LARRPLSIASFNVSRYGNAWEDAAWALAGEGTVASIIGTTNTMPAVFKYRLMRLLL
jgi:hypothetical protein